MPHPGMMNGADPLQESLASVHELGMKSFKPTE